MNDSHDTDRNVRRDFLLAALGALPLLAAAPAGAASLPAVDVYKNPSCGCCGGWVEHMRKAGFTVRVHEVADASAVRARLGLDAKYGSCHTATVANYVVEGHVPAGDVKRLLELHPFALGLAAPGMPAGSPGMEGAHRDAYDVLLVQHAGKASVFSHHS